LALFSGCRICASSPFDPAFEDGTPLSPSRLPSTLMTIFEATNERALSKLCRMWLHERRPAGGRPLDIASAVSGATALACLDTAYATASDQINGDEDALFGKMPSGVSVSNIQSTTGKWVRACLCPCRFRYRHLPNCRCAR